MPPPLCRRDPQLRDAVAVIQYLLWLEKTVPQGQVDEFSGAQHIDALRRSVPPPRPAPPSQGQPGTPSTSLLSSPLPCRAQERSRGPSFQSISASGLNAALAHYMYGWGRGGQWAGGGGQRAAGREL